MRLKISCLKKYLDLLFEFLVLIMLRLYSYFQYRGVISVNVLLSNLWKHTKTTKVRGKDAFWMLSREVPNAHLPNGSSFIHCLSCNVLRVHDYVHYEKKKPACYIQHQQSLLRLQQSYLIIVVTDISETYLPVIKYHSSIRTKTQR